MLKVNDLLSKANKTVGSVAGVCLGLAVISIAAAVIKDNVKHLFPRKKKIGVHVIALGEADEETDEEPSEVKVKSKKRSSKKEEVTGETGDIQEPAK